MLKPKILLLSLTIIAIMELLAMIVINYTLYADIIQFGTYVLLPVALIGVPKGLRKGVTTGILVRSSVYIILSTILFILAVPSYTYDQGKALILRQSSDQAVQFSIRKSRTLPATPGLSWLLYDRVYYYQVRIRQSGEVMYATVNPMTGQVLTSQHDYWSRP